MLLFLLALLLINSSIADGDFELEIPSGVRMDNDHDLQMIMTYFQPREKARTVGKQRAARSLCIVRFVGLRSRSQGLRAFLSALIYLYDIIHTTGI